MNLEVCQDLFVSLAVRSTFLALFIWFVLKCCERRSAPFRCALLTTGMIGLALLPLTWCLPRVEVPFLPNFPSAEMGPLGLPSMAGASSWLSSPLILLWFGGIGVIALTQSVGMWQLQRWKDRSQPLATGYWHGLLDEVSTSLAYRGDVALFRCPMIHSPAAAGLLRPCVFLPAEASEWDAERLRVVLLHEIGHLKRRDLWTQWLSQTVCALYWFHPMVWMLSRRLHQTREFACDHTVLSSGTEPSHYAKHLLALAKNLRERPRASRLVMANGLFLAMASPNVRQSALEERIRAILSFRSTRHLSQMLGMLLTVAGVSASWATATFAPIQAKPQPWPSAPGGIEPSGDSITTPAEMHLRLTADPFPGNE